MHNPEARSGSGWGRRLRERLKAPWASNSLGVGLRFRVKGLGFRVKLGLKQVRSFRVKHGDIPVSLPAAKRSNPCARREG